MRRWRGMGKPYAAQFDAQGHVCAGGERGASWDLVNAEVAPGQVHVELSNNGLGIGGERGANGCPGQEVGR